MFILIARKHYINFHNALDSNDSRGFKIIIILVFSKEAREDLIAKKNQKNPEQYEQMIYELEQNNFGAIQTYILDINPKKKFQEIMIESPINVIDCILFASFQDFKNKDSFLLFLGIHFYNKIIHVNSRKNGIYLRKTSDV